MCKFQLIREISTKLVGLRWCYRLFAKMHLYVLLYNVIWLLLSSMVKVISSSMYSGLSLWLVLLIGMWKKWGFLSSKSGLQKAFWLPICPLGTQPWGDHLKKYSLANWRTWSSWRTEVCKPTDGTSRHVSETILHHQVQVLKHHIDAWSWVI